MRPILLDTNAYSDFMLGKAAVVEVGRTPNGSA